MQCALISMRLQVLRILSMVILSGPFLCTSACFTHETAENAELTYPRNVESCVCRKLAWEADSYSRKSYRTMIEECNKTIKTSNPDRDPQEFMFDPEIDSLRCSDDVIDWRETIADAKFHEQSNRQLHSRVRRASEE